MKAVPSQGNQRWTPSDVVLLVAALFGAACYGLLLPQEHPDAAASYALGEEAAGEAAAAFFTQSGYSLDGYEAVVTLRRDEDLLNAIQAGLGRRAARRLLQQEGAQVPVYHWHVVYKPSSNDADDLSSYTLRVTTRGGVWDFERGGPRFGPQPPRSQDGAPSDPGRRVDADAFRTVVARSLGAPAREGAVRAEELVMPADSLLAATFTFTQVDSLWQRPPASLAPFNANKVFAVIRQYQEDPGGTFNATLEPAFAVALSRYHLQRTVWDADAFRADSVWRVPGNRVAHVRLVRTEPLYGRPVQADVVVSAGGALLELDVAFKTDTGHIALNARAGGDGVAMASDQEGSGETLRIVADVAQVLLYVVIGLIFMVGFFKRLTARLIDGKAAFLDMAVIGVLTALSLGLYREANFSEGLDSVWLELLVRLLISSVAGAFLGLFAMILSGTADSVARSVWSKKLHAASLVRLGSFRNVFVGVALLRGVGLALVLLGLVTVFLFVFPGAGLRFDDADGLLLDGLTWQPMTWWAASSGLTAFLVVTMGVLGVATFVARYRVQAWVVVGAVTVAMTVLQGALIDLAPIGYTWGLSASWGLALGLAFWRYDFLTCFTGFFVAHLIWGLSEGWLVAGSPALLDVGLAGLFVVGLVGLGVRGVASGETRHAASEYVPAYITELKQRERLTSELEIAREVQESFLPRKMPKVPGLDIAAMCLAAHEVGGDYYDFVEVAPGKLAVVVGDVSGKGTQAAFYMTLVKGIIQTLSREALSPAEVMRRLNMLFYENVTRGTFISMIYGIFDVEARTFIFARAGHNPVILKRSPSQEPDLVQPVGLAIGLVNGATFDDTIEECTLDLRLGDVLVFYTDGFSEAMNSAKDLYGDDRLAHKVSDVGQRSASDILHAVAEDVHHFVEAAGRHDDMTMVVVKLDRSAAPPIAAQTHSHVVAEA